MLEHDLLKLNVNEHTEKKQNLTYLSWAWAWQEALKVDPAATFHVQTFGDKPYMDVNGTAMVWVTVTMGGRSRTCFLPVMNSQNAPISAAGRTFKDKYGNEKVEKLDSFNVNTAIMRCMTKCLSLFGLGLYIYAGEDLPEEGEVKEEEKVEPKKEEPKKVEKKTDPNKFPLYSAKEIIAMADKKPEFSKQDKENLVLFGDTLLQYIEIQRSEADLKSYWKSNQEQIDKVKVHLPDLYDMILTKFKEAKEKAND